MIIRSATVADLPWIRRMWEALCAEGKAAHPHEYPLMDAEEGDRFTLMVYRHLTTNPAFRIYVAEDRQIVGFLAGQIVERAIGKPRLYCEPYWLYVDPAARGTRAARSLIDAGVAWLTENGVEHIEVSALAGDPQWARRRFTPFLQKQHITVADLLTRGRGAQNPPAKAPSRPRVSVRRKPKRRKIKPGRMNGVALEASDGRSQ